jgi:hypothetical protein
MITIHKDFLKSGDPDLTCPWGKTYTAGNPRGTVNLAECDDPRSAHGRAVREWVGLVERGRFGVEIGNSGTGDPIVRRSSLSS